MNDNTLTRASRELLAEMHPCKENDNGHATPGGTWHMSRNRMGSYLAAIEAGAAARAASRVSGEAPAKDTTALREALDAAWRREPPPEADRRYSDGWMDGRASALIPVEDALATQPSPEPLDVDRLARALQSGVAWMDVLFPDEWPYVAAKVAAEYARLAAEKEGTR